MTRKEQPAKAPAGFVQFLLARNPRLFAHHPDHPAFGEHVWTWRGLAFCKGCTVTFAGMLAGAVLYGATRWMDRLTDAQVGIVFLVLLLPTPVATLVPLPRLARHAARFLLGILLASAIAMLFVTGSWVVRVVIVVAYLAARVPLDRKRRRDNAALLAKATGRGTARTRP